ncbi:MAG TPA: ATP-binding cassette domain-containing protein [Candidatus Coprenecus stercoravium]|uniref:ATP-binding cassette domain-containing protein n=1 Tax=Candidatus Coprenecus stercoravium TaxID=2840735 RepID=A0A9D2K8Y6_9BACT|nr:ATP-binding cassette domain-containing protein [Candidatus Coprenecus stercoravium]
MITVNHLTKYFDGKPAISDISVQYKPGECSLVIGASGSGKTVLLKSVVGLLEPDEGEVLFDGTVFNKLPFKEKKVMRSKIGMLFQGSALFDFATALENVMFPLNFFSEMSRSEKLDRANFCLRRVGLENVERKYPSELSGGMQKRVGIARAIVLNPRYLFCDEPNSGLDPQTSVMIDRLIQEITQEYGITTVINTHDMNSVMEIGDNVAFIYNGRKLWEGSGSDIMLSDCKELEDFIFASRMAKELKLRYGNGSQVRG